MLLAWELISFGLNLPKNGAGLSGQTNFLICSKLATEDM